MIYLKSGTKSSIKLTYAHDVQICDVDIKLYLQMLGDIHISSGGDIIPDYNWNTLTTRFYSNIIHDTTQDVYNYNPIFQVYLYKSTYLMYRYSMIIPYNGNLSNIDGTTFKFKLAIQAL